MKAKEVGAFEAKTHFSELLRGVESGASYTITRKGRPVARLAPLEDVAMTDASTALKTIREARAGYHVTGREISEWRKAGQRK